MFESVNDALDTTSNSMSPGEGEQLINQTDLTLSVEKDSKEAFLNKSVITRKGMSLQFDNESLSNVTDTNMELQVRIRLNCICSGKKALHNECIILCYDYIHSLNIYEVFLIWECFLIRKWLKEMEQPENMRNILINILPQKKLTNNSFMNMCV